MFSDGIVVPCSNGEVKVLTDQLVERWGFSVQNPKNIFYSCRVHDSGSIALFTLDVAQQKKIIDLYEIDFSSRNAKLIKANTVDFIGSLAVFSSSLWLISKDRTELVFDDL